MITLSRIGMDFEKRAKKKAGGAMSIDRERGQELAAPLVCIWNELARLHLALEKGGPWPAGLTHAPVPLLPKSGMSAALGAPL